MDKTRRKEVDRILRKAKDLIDTPEKWAKNQMARNVNGMHVNVRNPDAVCFCSLGALYRAAHVLGIGYVRHIGLVDACEEVLMKYTGRCNLTYFNDQYDRNHDEIMHLFDQGIQSIETVG